MTIKDFRELRVYQMAFESAMRVYKLSRAWPAEERYGLTGQVLRSSRSVCANIAEGWRKRRYPASFVSKLSDADAEAAETGVWLKFAVDCRYLSDADHESLASTYDQICAQLVSMINQSDRWCL